MSRASTLGASGWCAAWMGGNHGLVIVLLICEAARREGSS